MNVDVTSLADASSRIINLAESGKSGYVCVANVHMCMESFDDPVFAGVVNRADIVVPDGKPLVWGQKLLGSAEADHVRGSDLLLAVCMNAEKKSIPIGLYGGTEESLLNFRIFLQKKFPDLSIVYAYSPPFREHSLEENQNVVKDIRQSGAKILFVGIGCPKQEKWMARQRNAFPCVMIGVGAAFDFFSGRKKHAPVWMQQIGLEWFFRLINEPRRLWKRYILQNPRFIYYFFTQIMKNNM
jgi:N-acetylglucosaminyldiphosphoundecaprenol N-acetyl-beta-D-mannosaminyltransferase